MRGAAKYTFSVGLAVLLLVGFWRIFRGIDVAEIWDALRHASLAGLALATALNLAQNVPRIWRWQVLLSPVRKGIGFRPMFGAVIIGYMTTFLVPGRLGELVRPALLSGSERVPLGPAVGSVVADRLVDGLTLVALFAVAVFVQPLEGAAAASGAVMRGVAAVLLAVVVGGLIALLALHTWRDRIEVWLGARSRVVAWIGRTALAFTRGMEALHRPRLLVLVLFHSVVCWLLIAAGTWIGIRACGVELSFNSTLVLLPLLALGIAIPTPGNVGGYHVVMAVTLRDWYGADPAVAVGAGILIQYVMIMLPYLVLGPVLMVVEGGSWRHLLELGRQVRGLGAAADGAAAADPVKTPGAMEGTRP